MEQLQDYFKNPDGSYKYDQPLLFTFEKSNKVEGDQYGPKVQALLTSEQGDPVEWIMSPSQATKRFKQTWDDGNPKFTVTEGVQISVKVIKLKNGRDFYAVENPKYAKPAEEKKEETTTTTVKADPTPTPAPATSKPSSNNEWDGSHRQQGYRIGRAGVLQAVIQNGAFSLKDDQEIAAMNSLVDDLFIENRKSADRLEKENPSH